MQSSMLTTYFYPTSPLLYCGLVHLGLFLLFFVLSGIDRRRLLGVNLWIKPMKFALSIAVYLLTWPFLLHYLPYEQAKNNFVIFTVIALSFEMLCIASQAARGEMSHYNRKGTYNFLVFFAMGIVIFLQTVFSIYIGILFCGVQADGQLSVSLLWGIRLGILISCLFALQGGAMASRFSHTVGARDGGRGLPFVNWSRSAGDLRVAHFAGLHALQVIPLFAYFVSYGSTAATFVFAAGYTSCAAWLFFRALAGIPLFS